MFTLLCRRRKIISQGPEVSTAIMENDRHRGRDIRVHDFALFEEFYSGKIDIPVIERSAGGSGFGSSPALFRRWEPFPNAIPRVWGPFQTRPDRRGPTRRASTDQGGRAHPGDSAAHTAVAAKSSTSFVTGFPESHTGIVLDEGKTI
jgi:hypothetical protein